MAITDILAAAAGGKYFALAGAAAGVDGGTAKAAVSRFAPAIATKLKAKAAADAEAFETLLDTLEEGGDLDDGEGMTDAEALSDGTDILTDLYGSPEKAAEALGVSNEADAKLACLSATGVLAALASSNAQSLSDDASKASSGSGGGGILSIIIAALLKGLLQGVGRQLRPKRRRRRYYYGYAPRRRNTRRKRRSPGLDQVFREILGR